MFAAQAAGWALIARALARSVVRVEGVKKPVWLPPAPAVPADTLWAVVKVLAVTRANCLSRSLVLQRWHADHGHPVDVVIGVTAPSAGFEAHAWIDPPGEAGIESFSELYRLRPSAGRVGTAASS